MDLDDLDRAMARLRTSMATVSVNLVELETDADRARLDQAVLSGTTADRWRQASQALSSLWQWFSQLNDLMVRAGQLRGTRAKLDVERRTELERLVAGPSIELSTADVPLARRGLLGPSSASVHCRADDLLAAMVSAFDQAKGVIAAAGQAWRDLEPPLQALGQRRAAADQLAASLGERHRPELVRLGAQLDALTRLVASDPLSVDRRAVDPLESALGSVESDLRGLVVLRDGVADRLSSARGQLEDLRRSSAAGVEAYREAVEKIAHPEVRAPLALPTSLENQLDQAAAAAGRAEWRSARQLLDQWAAAATSHRAEAQQILDANRAPLAARNELRGRLDAYRAKAYRAGRLEDRDVSELYAWAHDALYRAPTDLVVAADLVGRYQRALAGPASREVRS